MIKCCGGKILLAIGKAFLKNNYNNSYKFSNEFAFIYLLSFRKNPKQESSFSLWSGKKKYFCFLFIASRAVLRRYAEFNKLLSRIFDACSSYSFFKTIVEYDILPTVLNINRTSHFGYCKIPLHLWPSYRHLLGNVWYEDFLIFGVEA